MRLCGRAADSGAASAAGKSVTQLRGEMPAMVNTPEAALPGRRKPEIRGDPGGSGSYRDRGGEGRQYRRRARQYQRRLVAAARLNTQDVLVARAEARDEPGLKRLMAQIDEQLSLSGVARELQAGR